MRGGGRGEGEQWIQYNSRTSIDPLLILIHQFHLTMLRDISKSRSHLQNVFARFNPRLTVVLLRDVIIILSCYVEEKENESRGALTR